MEPILAQSSNTTNLLPYDGTVEYFGRVFPAADLQHWLEVLLKNIDWKNDEAMMFGKRIVTKRKMAWYGDAHFTYTYSKTIRKALPWTKALLEIKSFSEKLTGETFNSCLLNLYHDGAEAMGWHSDAEKELKKEGAIASLSFGAERKFSFKHKKDGTIVSVLLEAGSLLLMKGSTQTHWLHRLPAAAQVPGPRVNLTFRTII